MKRIFAIAGLICALQVNAQSVDEAIRYSWFIQQGTARNVATGGVMASLGGDITAAHVNPAGIGLFKTGEFAITPGMGFNGNKFNYRGNDTSVRKSGFGMGASGIILGGGSKYQGSKWTSTAISFSINQLANYNNRIQFQGINNVSSFTEQYLEELTRDRADTNAALFNYVFGSSLAFRTFLIDTLRGPSGNFIGYQSLVPLSTGVKQYYDATTTGGYNELALAMAGNMDDKLYLGGTLTVPIINYSRDLNYSEYDATNNTNNDFAFFQFREKLTSRGAGIGAKLGMIYKPQESFRIGVAFHTPQLLGFRDEIRAWLTANTEGYAGLRSENSDRLRDNAPGKRDYNVVTPLRAIVSASYVFREVNDTRMQKGFISADVEYVQYSATRYSAIDQSNSQLNNYYDLLNQTIKDYYKGNINARMGGELKFNTFMVRAGAAYYGSPYRSADLKADRFLVSGGLGYRNKGMFIDLSYAHLFNNAVQMPYALNDKANTFALQKGSIGNLVMTLGFKF